MAFYQFTLEMEGAQIGQDDAGRPVVLVGFRPVVLSIEDYKELMASMEKLSITVEMVDKTGD